jgi:hypothetical protein
MVMVVIHTIPFLVIVVEKHFGACVARPSETGDGVVDQPWALDIGWFL